MPNLFSYVPVVILECVPASTLGFTRTATGAILRRRVATREMRTSSASDSTFETVDALAQGEGDFVLRLADPGKDALTGIAAGSHDPGDFAAGYCVEPGAEVRQGADGEASVRLDGEANQVIDAVAGQRAGQFVEMIGKRGLGVDVQRRAIALG